MCDDDDTTTTLTCNALANKKKQQKTHADTQIQQQCIQRSLNVAILHWECKCQIRISRTNENEEPAVGGAATQRETKRPTELMRSNNSRKQLHYGTEQLQIGCCRLFLCSFFLQWFFRSLSLCIFVRSVGRFVHCKCHSDVYLRVHNVYIVHVYMCECVSVSQFCVVYARSRICMLYINSLFFSRITTSKERDDNGNGKDEA